MSCNSRRFQAGVLAASLPLCLAVWANAVPNLPQPNTHVADYAHVIDASSTRQIDGWLTELEQKTTAQVIILTVNSLDGEPIEKFTIDLMSKWKLGQKGKDNGVLMCVAVKDRKYRIEVGYGLEGALPDSWCGSIAREYFVPNFRTGNFGRGLYQATTAVANRIADEYHVKVSGLPAVRHRRRNDNDSGLALGMVIFFVIIFISIVSRGGGGSRGRRRRGWGGFWWGYGLGNMTSGSWGGSSSGWSSGGGGFSGGSFGGGGGGSFGGGGASGG